MTDSTTTTAADDGGTAPAENQEHPVAVLRRNEGRGLIELASSAQHATSDLVHHLHLALWGPQGVVPVTDLKAVLSNARACLQVTDNYLGQLNEPARRADHHGGPTRCHPLGRCSHRPGLRAPAPS